MTKDRRLYKKGGQNNKQVRKQLVFGYLSEPAETRLSLPKFLRLHKMVRRTFYNLEGEYKVEKRSGVEEHKRKLKVEVMDVWDRIEGREPVKRDKEGFEVSQISGNEKLALARKVYKDAMEHKATARDKDLAVRMLGMLIEKHEVKVGLSADEVARRNLEADRQLKEEGFGK